MHRCKNIDAYIHIYILAYIHITVQRSRQDSHNPQDRAPCDISKQQELLTNVTSSTITDAPEAPDTPEEYQNT